MENLDEGVSPPSSPAPLTVSKRPLARFARHWDFLAVLLLIGASLPLAWISSSALVVVSHPGTFDDHWVLDTVFKASRGVWFGRDVAFVYGPLFQWLISAPARWAGVSMGSIYASFRTFLLWPTYLLGFLTLRLLLPRQAAWKRFLLLILLSVFWAPTDARTAFAIFLFALFLRGCYAVRDGRLQPAIFGCGTTLSCAVAFLYSADTGVFGIAALLLALAGVAWEGRREAHKMRLYAIAVGAFALSSVVLVFLFNAAMASLLDFSFWKSSFALVAVHRWNEPSTMSQESAIRLVATLIVGAVVFLARWLLAADRTAVAARLGFLLSAFAFSVLAMQTGLVRSDPNHVVFAIFPMVFFAGVVLFSFSSRLVSVVAAGIAIACSVLFAQPAPTFQPASLRYRYVQFRYPLTACPAGFTEFDHACFPVGFGAMLETTANYLRQHTPANAPVLIFPYQYMFGMAAGRNVAGVVEQSLLAVGPYLSHLEIATLQRAAAPAGLYFPDGNLSLPIDGVPNFTRNSEIWMWIFQHYRAEQTLAPEVVGLQRDESRAARISRQPMPLGFPAQAYPIRECSAQIDLGLSYWPSGADFLRLRMTVHYGPLWKVRKPERLQLEITRADGSSDVKTFVVEPNVSSEVWFYPWNDSELANYFGADETQWRTAPHSAITRLRLLVTPWDWVSQQPESITIESADAVTVSMVQP
jgi:hypothetical protein